MKTLRRIAQLLMPVALVLTVNWAHAALTPAERATPTVTVGDASAPELGRALPTLTFTFDGPYELTTAVLYVDYDASKMTFNAAASTLKMGPLFGGYQATLEFIDANSGGNFFYTADESVPGAYSLSMFFATSFYPLPSGPSFVLTGAFDLRPGFTAGMTGAINLSGALTSTDHDLDPSLLPDTFGEGGQFQLPGPPLAATVTAVPEPETWLMLLGGLGLIAARVRRRNNR